MNVYLVFLLMNNDWFPTKPFNVKKVNSSPNDKIWDSPKSKAFADNTVKAVQMMIAACNKVVNIVEKEKMLVTTIFSFFHNVFKTYLFQGHKKSDYVVKCLSLLFQTSLMSKWLNPFPNTPFWDHPKFKEAADNNWNVAIKRF